MVMKLVSVINIMVEIDNDRLTQLIEVCKQSYPDIDPYIIWVYSVDYLLNEQGIYGDEKEGKRLYDRKQNDYMIYAFKVLFKNRFSFCCINN